MKTILCTLIFVNCWTMFSQTKHALVVAVADYPKNEKGEDVWTDLSSNYDVELVKEMLKEQRFLEQNCLYLLDKDATPENLDKAFKKLLENLKLGDMVYFHYSGHGQQVADIKPKKRKGIVGGDEADGLDEALVLYNAPKNMVNLKDYEMEHHYVDDQMKVQFEKIRKKIGAKGQVVLVIDACHSGTSTRGADEPKVRGTKEKCVPSDWKASNASDTSEAFGTDFEYNTNTTMGKMVAFFGCKSDQVNNEYLPEGSNNRYGSLTYFFIKGLKKLGESNSSYANLFSEIRKNMLIHFSGLQVPEIEGDDLNQLLFGDGFIPAKPFFNVESIYYDVANIQAGSLSGLDKGDEIGLFGTDVNNPKDATPLFTGKITEVSVLKASIKLNSAPTDSKNSIGLYRAFLLKKGATGAEIKVKLELKKHKKEIESRLEQMSNITLVKSDYQFKVKENEAGKVLIYVGADDNMPLKNMNPMTMVGSEQYDSLVFFLKQASQIEMLRKLKVDDWNIDFSFEMYNKNDRTNKLPLENLKLIEGKDYGIKFTNTGNTPIFVYVLDIQPDYKINFADRAIVLKENSSIVYPLEDVTPPYGIEHLVFVGSRELIDLSPLKELGKEIKTRGEAISPLVAFINTSASGTRSANANPEQVTVKSMIFEIKPKP